MNPDIEGAIQGGDQISPENIGDFWQRSPSYFGRTDLSLWLWIKLLLNAEEFGCASSYVGQGRHGWPGYPVDGIRYHYLPLLRFRFTATSRQRRMATCAKSQSRSLLSNLAILTPAIANEVSPAVTHHRQRGDHRRAMRGNHARDHDHYG
jgi:hypothetical protein